MLATTDALTAPLLGALGGAALALLLWHVGKRRGKQGVPLRFLGALAAAWVALCLGFLVVRPGGGFAAYLLESPLATEVLALVGAAFYVHALVRFRPAERRWRRSSGLLAGTTLMAVAYLRAAYAPAITLWVQVPLTVLMLATVWRFQAEPLVYLAVLGAAVGAVLGARTYLVSIHGAAPPEWVTSTASAVALAMVVLAAFLSLHPHQVLNVKWYRQGLLIVPLAVASLAAMAAGGVAVWHGVTWHTAWALGVWWTVLLVSAVGLKQPDLFGFSCVGAALAAVTVFALLDGPAVGGWWGRYPSVLLLLALGAAALAGILEAALRRRRTYGFPRALYLAGVATAVGALALEPFGTTAEYLGIDLLIASAVLALAHAHGAPRWVNYLVAATATGGFGALVWVEPAAGSAAHHHRFIQVAAAVGVGWLVLALVLREALKRVLSDRQARREIEPFTVWGMTATLVLAGYLSVQQTRAYVEFLTAGTSPTVRLIGPGWGLLGWLAVLLAFLLSMWLFRHTLRTFFFYVFGIMATVYAGLFHHTDDLYRYLIYAVGGYGSAHLLVYLYERRFMELLSRTCALYRDERRASTTIFTLAVISTFVAAVLAMFRLHTHEALLMLGLMSVVYLGWSFVWLRGEMLYPAVFMLTLTILAIWHNTVHATAWTPYRLSMNAMILSTSAVVWLGFGNRLHALRSELFQLAAPARACSAVLGVLGFGFAVALALSPAFGSAVWQEPRSLGDWAMGLGTFSALILYFTWAGFVLRRRFYHLMSGLGVLVLGLYVGIYVGVRLAMG